METQLGRHPRDRLRVAVVSQGGKRAVSEFRQVGQAAWGEDLVFSLVEARLHTGRTHQVRVHLAHVGLPVVGDPVYGRKRVPESARGLLTGVEHQLLHAWRLGFDHPEDMGSNDKRRVIVDHPPPSDFRAVLERLGLPTSPPMSWSRDMRVTITATAVESSSAGICATRPSPMVSSA